MKKYEHTTWLTNHFKRTMQKVCKMWNPY